LVRETLLGQVRVKTPKIWIGIFDYMKTGRRRATDKGAQRGKELVRGDRDIGATLLAFGAGQRRSASAKADRAQAATAAFGLQVAGKREHIPWKL
jgi:hypothetical protein